MSRRLIALFIAAGVFASGCSTLDAINPFSSSGSKGTPLPALTGNATVRSLWSESVGKAGDYVFTPAVVGNSVYFTGRDGVLIKQEGGKRLWKINVGQTLSAGVGADTKLVVVGTPKGDVLAYSTEDGKLVWQAKASSEILAAPAVSDAGVIVKSGDNRVFLFDAASGARKWVYQRATPSLAVRGAGAPIFADQYAFVGFPGGKLVALSLMNGAPVWEGAVALPKGATELDRVADVVASPVADGRQLCAVAFQGRIACFDMGQGGAMTWSRDISSAVEPVLDGRYLFAVDDKGVIYAMDRLSGSSVWKQDKLKGRKISAPIVRQGMVVVGDGEGYVHFLSREDGSVIARSKVDSSPIRSQMQALGSTILVQTAGGSVSALEVQ